MSKARIAAVLILERSGIGMRFYIKLLLLVLAFVGIQKVLVSSQAHIRDALFTIRCGIAFETHNEPMIQRLAAEAQRAREQSLACSEFSHP
jgi:hypothetical protein